MQKSKVKKKKNNGLTHDGISGSIVDYYIYIYIKIKIKIKYLDYDKYFFHGVGVPFHFSPTKFLILLIRRFQFEYGKIY